MLIDARGNLTLAQAGKVAGCSAAIWCHWENERYGAPVGLLKFFRMRAKEMFPKYRCDLRQI